MSIVVDDSGELIPKRLLEINSEKWRLRRLRLMRIWIFRRQLRRHRPTIWESKSNQRKSRISAVAVFDILTRSESVQRNLKIKESQFEMNEIFIFYLYNSRH